MRRTIAGLTALLVSYAVSSSEDAEAGRRRASCCPQPTCCAPRVTCCTPQPTCCAPSSYCGGVGPKETSAYVCIQSQMFTFGGNTDTCVYIAYCYPSSCNDTPTQCMWDDSCSMPTGGAVPQYPCGSNCAVFTGQICAGKRCKIANSGTSLQETIDWKGKKEADAKDYESKHLGKLKTGAINPDLKIVAQHNVTFKTLKSDGTDTVNARLLVIEWKNPTPPLDDGNKMYFAIGYEVQNFPDDATKTSSVAPDVPNAATDAYRTVHFDMDYAVKIYPSKLQP
jgi:hypothetical protein